MIISINATVCGDINHGGQERFKIAGSTQAGLHKQSRNGRGDQHKHKLHMAN
jgi:hypothetical protein